MNFNEIENIEKQVASTEYNERNYYQSMFDEYIEKEQNKDKIKDNPFVYFYEDVIAAKIECDFQPVLGDNVYKNASEDALNCLSICNEFCKLSIHSVNGWLQNALKFADHIVLHYIQEVCKELPQKYPNAGIEKSRYIQLSEKSGDIATAGTTLIELYDLRNSFEHRTKIHSDGTQELIPLQKNKTRRKVTKNYPLVLKKLMKMYIGLVSNAGVTEFNQSTSTEDINNLRKGLKEDIGLPKSRNKIEGMNIEIPTDEAGLRDIFGDIDLEGDEEIGDSIEDVAKSQDDNCK